MSRRRPIVCVIGSGKEEWTDRATELGRWLATKGVHLLTGGGAGVMASVSQAFAEVPTRKGMVIGVIPCKPDDPRCLPKDGYPNPWVEIPISTHLPLSGMQGTDSMSRNHVNVLSSDVVIALPGGAGTASEAILAVQYGRPMIAYLEHETELPGLPEVVQVTKSFTDVQRFLKTHLTLHDS